MEQKTGIFRLFGQRYKVGPDLARRRVEVRYDLDALDELEVWLDGRFRERARPVQIKTHRGPRITDTAQPGATEPAAAEPAVDWLGHLVARDEASWQDPEAELRRLLDEEARQSVAIMAVFETRLHPDVFDRAALSEWLHVHGPLDPTGIGDMLDFIVDHMGASQHQDQYLDALHATLLGGEA